MIIWDDEVSLKIFLDVIHIVNRVYHERQNWEEHEPLEEDEFVCALLNCRYFFLARHVLVVVAVEEVNVHGGRHGQVVVRWIVTFNF